MMVVTPDAAIDMAAATAGRLPASPRDFFDQWDEFCNWADQAIHITVPSQPGPGGPPGDVGYGPPSPEPRQIFAIGLNYRDHAAESGVHVPDSPVVFTKFATALTGPTTLLPLPSSFVDWEAELVVVMGRHAEAVRAEDAWGYVAGLTVGQDYSERAIQMAGDVPQFSLGKSFPGFAPTGPVLVTVNEFAEPDDLAIECLINGESVQKSRTSSMIFPVPELIARLSAVCPLLPGDLIFTGTPAGVGVSRQPPRFLAPGDEVVTRIEGIGELRQRCVGEEI
jgi:2-keto-4-pentenoate hydratase/2-oxohepta-3-ene-1,7-dioic acid hydratase in catechol pathway